MTDTYEQLKNLFEDEQTIDDLWDSGDIVWIDWREDDEDIISYFNDLLEERVEVQTIDNAKPYGPDIVLSKAGKQFRFLTARRRIATPPLNTSTTSLKRSMGSGGSWKV